MVDLEYIEFYVYQAVDLEYIELYNYQAVDLDYIENFLTHTNIIHDSKLIALKI